MAWVLVGALALVGVGAQQPAADPGTLKAKVDRLRNDVRRAEQEVRFTEDSMLRLDADVERELTSLVDLVAKSKESAATDGRIAACRATTVAGLRRVIALYVAERERRRQHGWDVSRLDERIDRRINEMAKVAAASDSTQEAVKTTGLLDDLWIDAALKDMKAGKYLGAEVQTRADLVKELEAAVEFLTSRRDTLTLQLAVTADPAEREKLAQEIEFAETMADKRRQQAAEILAAPPADQATPVGVDTASALEKSLRDGRKVLRVKLMDLQKLATTRDYQQKRADYLKKQLADTQAAMDRQANPQ